MNNAEIRNLWEHRKKEWIDNKPAIWCSDCNDNCAEFCECEYRTFLRKFTDNPDYTSATRLCCSECHSQFGESHSTNCNTRYDEIVVWLNKINWNHYQN